MSITNGFLGDYAHVVGRLLGPSPPDRAGAAAGAAAGTEVDCRSALLTAGAEPTPELRPVRTLLDACRDDPARFQEEVLGRRLWAKQVEVCQAIARSPITVVPAGRAVGKSFLLAGTVLWCPPPVSPPARPSPGGFGALGDPRRAGWSRDSRGSSWATTI